MLFYRISFLLFKFSITQHCWKFIFIRAFNNEKSFWVYSKYTIVDFIWKYLLFINIVSPVYFCVLIINKLSQTSLIQYWQIFYLFVLFCDTHPKAREISSKLWETCKNMSCCTRHRAITSIYNCYEWYFFYFNACLTLFKLENG